jgi:hypothetical protein
MISNDVRDKMQAAMLHDWPDAEKRFPPRYVEACGRWFAALSEADSVIAVAVRTAFDRGDEKQARKIAAALPPAPRRPLHDHSDREYQTARHKAHSGRGKRPLTP